MIDVSALEEAVAVRLFQQSAQTIDVLLSAARQAVCRTVEKTTERPNQIRGMLFGCLAGALKVTVEQSMGSSVISPCCSESKCWRFCWRNPNLLRCTVAMQDVAALLKIIPALPLLLQEIQMVMSSRSAKLWSPVRDTNFRTSSDPGLACACAM